MFRRMTLVTLALALMTTLAAPVAWGQPRAGTSELRDVVDPNGQPLSASPYTVDGLGLTNRSTAVAELSTRPSPAASGPMSTPVDQVRLALSLTSHFLAQLLGI